MCLSAIQFTPRAPRVVCVFGFHCIPIDQRSSTVVVGLSLVKKQPELNHMPRHGHVSSKVSVPCWVALNLVRLPQKNLQRDR